MIRGLRRTHLVVWLVLAIVLPVLLVLALSHRHRPPINAIPPELANP